MDFTPKILNQTGNPYDNTEKFTLLGVDLVTDNIKGINFATYINSCIQKAYKSLWILRRLAEFGASIEELYITYKLRIRTHIEQNAPLWMFSLTQELKKKIERVQKISLYVILGKEAHEDYLCNLAILNAQPLEERRQKIALKFASNILKHPEHRKIFSYTGENTRSKKTVVVPFTRTVRYQKSTVPALAQLINQKLAHKI